MIWYIGPDVMFLLVFDSRKMRRIVCESMLSDTVAMENQTALRAAWLCGRAWFLETRLKQQFRFQMDVLPLAGKSRDRTDKKS